MHRNLNRLRLAHIIRRARGRFVVEVIANRITFVDLGRDHLSMNCARVVAQKKCVNTFDPDRFVKRMRSRLFLHDDTLICATGQEKRAEEEGRNDETHKKEKVGG